jgi:AcrR family transcriptional regulator
MASAAPGVRERLLEVAGALFYAEGIHAVGVDRVIGEAGVAKATLYAHFGGKDDLVAAYLARQSQWWQAAVGQRADGREPGSAAAVLSPFDVLQERATAPGYRGCPFINAAAEFPGPGPVAGQVAAHRSQVRATFSRLLGGTDADAGLLGALIALYDGAMSAAYLDHDPSVVAHARHGAEMILRSGQA